MDEHKEKEADKFHESSEQQQPLKPEAADDDEDTSKESMDQQQHQEGYKEATTAEEEPTVQRRKEVESGSEEASSPLGIFAHPCSLLQYLLRAFSGWCWAPLHGAFDDGPKPQQAVAPEAVAPANSTEQGGGDGMKADNEEVVTRVWAVRRVRPPPGAPGRPREGRGGNGGIHH